VDKDLTDFENTDYDYWKGKDLKLRERQGILGGAYLIVPIDIYRQYYKQMCVYFTIPTVTDHYIRRVEESGMLKSDYTDMKTLENAYLMCHLLLSATRAMVKMNDRLNDKGTELLNNLNQEFSKDALAYLDPATHELEKCLGLMPQYHGRNDIAIANLMIMKRRLEERGVKPIADKEEFDIPYTFP